MEIPKPLPVGTYNVKVVVTGDIVKEEHSDNQDSTVDVTYILKAHTVELIA